MRRNREPQGGLPSLFGLFDFQSFGCFSLVLVHYLGVDLGCSDILVGEHLADYVDVGAGAEEEGGVGVAEAVECDMFVDACVFKPSFKFSLYECVGEAFEDDAFARFAAEFKGFISDWQGCVRVSLVGCEADAVATVGVVGYVIPGEVTDVSEAEAGEAGKEGCPAEHVGNARGVGKCLEFFHCEVFTMGVGGVDGVEFLVDVVLYLVVFVGDGEEAAEGGPVAGG